MNRLEHLAEVEQALQPVRDLLTKTRLGVTTQFNPLVMQLALAYAHVHAIAALAADDPEGYGDAMVWTDEAAAVLDQLPLIHPQPDPPPPTQTQPGLIVPN